MPRARAQLSG
jgi:hypothetical protein